ncbi:conserved hypothetical protein [Nitrospina gracilis 3/211]|uniref:Uncharacterized protein n=1 Tax=Nitrospina gracilis (strain 3/211) TaxID=1266370 RepID=M1ZBU2_NITG3|nr:MULTISPECIES: hypothetical protein [Nitrospina]MCF8723608.1 hypothetical protein [Nitrospina sp. Nb-3]CCQ90689.1 conserved hypothetical protein [Nitrospina gracilis 3/211]
MLGNKFRPWGLMPWIWNKIPNVEWDLLGCLSTEQRCLGSLIELQKRNCLNSAFFLEIIDLPLPEYVSESEAILKNRRNEFKGIISGKPSKINSYSLFEDPITPIFAEIDQFIGNCNGNILLDISSFPKRYFFPIVKKLLQSDASKVDNILIAYTAPKSYFKGELAKNPGGWHHLPLFGPQVHPDPPVELAIVGVGFLPFGLAELLKASYQKASLKLLFPFPPGPPNYQRTWGFVERIQREFKGLLNEDILRVGFVDASDAFRHICMSTNFGQKNAIFAPYGPKPISLAMCLYASLYDSIVYYTQPEAYNPHYCSGINKINGNYEIYIYCIRLNQENYYVKQ